MSSSFRRRVVLPLASLALAALLGGCVAYPAYPGYYGGGYYGAPGYAYGGGAVVTYNGGYGWRHRGWDRW